ncbi:MAG: RHS repeat-associated core domain-containing protein [Paludibacteraceae bacterium]|nr:RHS repeat-associated core domain-containing protein [Paludibacteraceae bacterium]
MSNRPEWVSEIYYYHSDHLGSTSWVTDGGGNPIEYISYLPYGEEYQNERFAHYDDNIYGKEARYRFTGKELDRETGYTYNEQRYLCTDYGFWTRVDPLVDKYLNISPYAYCNNNPLKYVDPDGRQYESSDDLAFHDELYSAVEAKLTELENKPGMHRKEIKSLNNALNELDYMKSTEDFIFHFDKTSQAYGAQTNIIDGKIVMELPQEESLCLGIHEASHAYDLSQKILELGGDIGNNGDKAKRLIYNIVGEQKAYQRQFLIGGYNSMPKSKYLDLQPGEHMTYNDITPLYIRGIELYEKQDDGICHKKYIYESIERK